MSYFNDLVEAMDDHALGHGTDCFCMDYWIREIRSLTTCSTQKSQDRMDYVLISVVSWRPRVQ